VANRKKRDAVKNILKMVIDQKLKLFSFMEDEWARKGHPKGGKPWTFACKVSFWNFFESFRNFISREFFLTFLGLY
jgi:hypothetical protein